MKLLKRPRRSRETKGARLQREAYEVAALRGFAGTLREIRDLPEVTRP